MPVTLTFITTATASIELTSARALSTSLFFTSQIFGTPVWGRPVTTSSQRISSTVTTFITDRIKSFYTEGAEGYGLRQWNTIPISSSTRVSARTFNRILQDVDRVYRHQTSATVDVLATATGLSTFTSHLVITTATALDQNQSEGYYNTFTIVASTWSQLIKRIDEITLNRYSVHPGQLVRDSGGCITVYDGVTDTRTAPWGGGSTGTVTACFEVEWPRAALANSFFNLGGDFVLTPFWSSFGTQAQTTTTGLINYSFQTALDTFVNVDYGVNGTSGGRGPLFHVDYGQAPYGAARVAGSTDYFYPVSGGPGVSGNGLLLNASTNSPVIAGTPFQLVGLHYGDYTTKLVIGIQQGQSVPLDQTSLRIQLPSGLFPNNYYDVTVPGYLDLYTGPTGGLPALNGWWVYEYDPNTESFQDRQIAWLDIYSGRKGPDPIGLKTAIESRQAHQISIRPLGVAPSIAVTSAVNTANNAMSLLINELYVRSLATPTNIVNTLYSYNRSHWVAAAQTTTTVFTSPTWTGASLSITAERDQSAVGLSRRIKFWVTATTWAPSTTMTYNDAYSNPAVYNTSSITCTNVTSVNNSYDGSTGETIGTPSGGGGGIVFYDFGWWGNPWWKETFDDVDQL